ncbi:MAG: DUF4391 domain-containing protein [Coriobacteriales bacterium]|jgi:hypothetical protein
MSVRWEDILRLPEAAYTGGRRLPKTVLTSRAMLTKNEQRTLDKVRRLEHFATVAKGTARVLPRVDDDHDIQSVIFLRCVMARDTQAVAEVAQLLHGCFPNPTVILQEAGDDIALSVNLTRRSYAEHGATVVYDVESTGLFDPTDTRYAPFLDTLSFERQPQDDLLSYLEAIASQVKLSQAIAPLGFYPSCHPDDRGLVLNLIDNYKKWDAQVKSLLQLHQGKDVTPNQSARLRMEIRRAKGKRSQTLREIEQLCDKEILI